MAVHRKLNTHLTCSQHTPLTQDSVVTQDQARRMVPHLDTMGKGSCVQKVIFRPEEGEGTCH